MRQIHLSVHWKSKMQFDGHKNNKFILINNCIYADKYLDKSNLYDIFFNLLIYCHARYT